MNNTSHGILTSFFLSGKSFFLPSKIFESIRQLFRRFREDLLKGWSKKDSA